MMSGGGFTLAGGFWGSEAMVLPSGPVVMWTNLAGGNWSVASNWSPNRLPGAADTAVIAGSGT